VYLLRRGSELSFSGDPPLPPVLPLLPVTLEQLELELELLELLRLPPVDGESGSELLARRESPVGRVGGAPEWVALLR
jgi:hypothetical protein